MEGCRFIPAHAGNTKAVARTSAMLRFIPAHAGNTSSRAGPYRPSTVHPRARGEHFVTRLLLLASLGSSPRTRGTLPSAARRHKWTRFIPAHAGNTPPPEVSRRSLPVHPRARGEHADAHRGASRVPGSSPRTRGTLAGNQVGVAQGRFIPAHAGNTVRAGAGSQVCPVHPRARGEHQALGSDALPVIGSSPRTRGTHRFPPLRCHGGRFIPAHAGNTSLNRPFSSS